MSIKIKIGRHIGRNNGEIEQRAKEYLKVIGQTKEYLEYGKEIGCSVAAMVHDATKWDPSIDKNLDSKEVAEIEKIMMQSRCNEVNSKNPVIKDIFNEVTQRAKTYIEIFESRKNYLKYGLENGWAVAHELAQGRNWYPEMDKNLSKEDIKEILKWKSHKFGWTVAHLIARNQKTYREDLWSTKDLDILESEDNSNSLVAFALIYGMWSHTIWYNIKHKGNQRYLPPWMKDENGNPNMKILSLRNSKGETVAYHYAHRHGNYWLCDDMDILKLDDGKGTTVAHELAQRNHEWPSSKLANSPEFRNILMLSNSSGVTVAHNLAWYYNGSNQSEPLRGWKTDDIEILSLVDKDGNTVAHKLAEHCSSNHWTTKDPRILSLKNNKGVSVEEILKKNRCI